MCEEDGKELIRVRTITVGKGDNARVECLNSHRIIKPSSLKAHLSSNAHVYPHVCDLCDTRSTRRADLGRHLSPRPCSRQPIGIHGMNTKSGLLSCIYDQISSVMVQGVDHFVGRKFPKRLLSLSQKSDLTVCSTLTLFPMINYCLTTKLAPLLTLWLVFDRFMPKGMFPNFEFF